MIDAATALAFSLFENKGVYALLLGSGISRAAQIPTGWEVTLNLIQRIAALKGITSEPDWAAWYLREFSKEPNYSEVLDELSSTADERRAILHSFINPDSEDLTAGRKVPTRAHRAAAKLVQDGFIRVIITTNFDRLMEKALQDVGIAPTVIKSDDDLKGAVPLIHSRCYLVKVHGDYLDTRIRNIERELASYSSELDTLLDRIFDEHGLLVCGWSGDWDIALRSAITRAPSRRYPLFWATRGTPSEIANDLITHRDGKIIRIDDADTFFERLERMVSAQTELQRANPQSTEILVVSAKKYLSRSEYRIQLDELIGDELRKVQDAMLTPDFGVAASNTGFNEAVVKLVARYEVLLEPLVRIFGVLGRWGNGSEFETTTDIITQFAPTPQIAGMLVLIYLRTYPGVLLFYAYGLALIKARRYKDLFRLFQTPVLDAAAKEKNLVSTLFLGAWDGGNEETIWKLLPGLERRRTALSDHLHDILKPLVSDYLYSDHEFSALFLEFEFLAALAFLTLNAEETDFKKSETLDQWGRNFVWAPVGRILWDHENRNRIVKSFENKEKLSNVLMAGFAKESPAYFSAAVANLSRLWERARWG
ncbi:MAG: SIR2 family protein [Candidatus Pacebacteria bacterium]|nr:SIR2 family protein [Candidatus Paceibacterota bacterium]